MATTGDIRCRRLIALRNRVRGKTLRNASSGVGAARWSAKVKSAPTTEEFTLKFQVTLLLPTVEL